MTKAEPTKAEPMQAEAAPEAAPGPQVTDRARKRAAAKAARAKAKAERLRAKAARAEAKASAASGKRGRAVSSEGKRPKKELRSADGTPYTPWQRRTRVLCILLLIYASLEVVSGIVFVSLGYGMGFWLGDVAGGVSVRLYTLLFGIYNVVLALLGLRGAKDPSKVTLFFWAVLINVVLMSWQLASDISLGIYEVSSMISFVAMFAFALCGWKLREQTGYFDNHPKPEDDQPAQP